MNSDIAEIAGKLETIEKRLTELNESLKEKAKQFSTHWPIGKKVQLDWFKYDQITLRNERCTMDAVFLGFTPPTDANKVCPQAIIRLPNDQIVSIDPQEHSMRFKE